MVSEPLRQLLIAGDGVGEFDVALPGELDGATVSSGRAEHVVCGDEVQLSVCRNGDRIRGVRWRAVGCPATLAISALAHRVLIDVRTSEAARCLQQAIVDHGGLASHERHAASMVLRALAAAVGG